MNTLHKTLISIFAGTLMTAGAQAALINEMNLKPYVGVKIGQYNSEVDNNNDIEDTTSYGAYGGTKFSTVFGAEAEFLATQDEEIFNNNLSQSEYSANIYGLYATADYNVPNTALYAKGRLGIAKNKVDVDYIDKFNSENCYSTSESETGLSGSLGLGYGISPNVSIEAMYNVYPSIDLENEDDWKASGLTLGAHLNF